MSNLRRAHRRVTPLSRCPTILAHGRRVFGLDGSRELRFSPQQGESRFADIADKPWSRVTPKQLISSYV
jgi:hypothetical protein